MPKRKRGGGFSASARKAKAAAAEENRLREPKPLPLPTTARSFEIEASEDDAKFSPRDVSSGSGSERSGDRGRLAKTNRSLAATQESDQDSSHVNQSPRLSASDASIRGTRSASAATSHDEQLGLPRKRSLEDLEQDALSLTDGEREGVDAFSDRDAESRSPSKRPRADSRDFLKPPPLAMDTDSGAGNTPDPPVKRGRGRPRRQRSRSPATSANPSKPVLRLPGRRRNVIDPRIEDDLLRQADLRRRYRSLVKLVKPSLAELADRTVKGLTEDHQAHKKLPEYDIVMKGLNERFDRNVASQERQFRLARDEKETMFQAEQHAILGSFQHKIQEMQEDYFLRYKDEVMRLAALPGADADGEATDDEGGYPERRKRKGTWLDPVHGLSRSGFYLQVERDWTDFVSAQCARRAMKAALRVTAPDALIERPTGFAVLDENHREGVLATVNLDTLTQASEALQEMLTAQRAPVVANSQALGLQTLAAAIEQKVDAGAPAPRPPKTPIQSPGRVEALTNGGDKPLASVFKTPENTQPIKPASKSRSRRKAAVEKQRPQPGVLKVDTEQAPPRRSTSSAYFSNILNAEDTPPTPSGRHAGVVTGGAPPTSARGLPAIAARPAASPREQMAEPSPATPQERQQHVAPASDSPIVLQGQEPSMAQTSPTSMFGAQPVRYLNGGHPPQAGGSVPGPGPHYTRPEPSVAYAPDGKRPTGPDAPWYHPYLQTNQPVPPPGPFNPQFSPRAEHPAAQQVRYAPPPPHSGYEQSQRFAPGPAPQMEQVPRIPERRGEYAPHQYGYYQDNGPPPAYTHPGYPAQHDGSQPLPPPPPYQPSYSQYPPGPPNHHPPSQGYHHPLPPPPPPPPAGPPPLSRAVPPPQSPYYAPGPPPPPSYQPAPPQGPYAMQGPPQGNMPGHMGPSYPQQVSISHYQPTGPPEQHPSLRPNFSTSDRRGSRPW